jgi:hypothetical protein
MFMPCHENAGYNNKRVRLEIFGNNKDEVIHAFN